MRAPTRPHPLPNLSHSERDLRRSLNLAVQRGQVEKVQALLDQGACALGPFNEENNQTLLHYASLTGRVELVQALLGAGVEADYVDNYGWTPMRYAYYYGKKGMVEELKSAGVSLSDTLVSQTWTPLMQASAAGALQEMANLISVGHEVDATDGSGQTALHLSCVRGDAEATALLLRHGASSNVQDIYGWTPLMCAARSKHLGLVVALLGAGANPLCVDMEGFTVLHTAAQMGHLDVLCTVLDWRSDLLELRDNRNRTALILGAQYEHAEVVNWLLCEGAAVNARSRRNESALGVAAARGSAICERLLRAGADVSVRLFDQQQSPLMLAAHMDADETVSLLLRFGSSLEQEDKDGVTALAYAANENSVKAARVLLKAGANPDATQCLPLRVAARHGYADVIYELLCHGASPNPRETQMLTTGMSPLHYAATYNQLDAAFLLLQAGASRTSVDQYGVTAAVRAEQQGFKDCARLIRTFRPTLQHLCAAKIWSSVRDSAGPGTDAKDIISKLPVGYGLQSLLAFPYSTTNMIYDNKSI